ncbi:hypothetical protein SAMN05421874_107271 [Nonomuraea maritima]|uniref:Uncharacterized protein n=1 Tax=Nonomuraea maritima TaxID=683260 RepID=A0A1G9BS15_9ACTN|nr:hypothetical protein SAMN05421874_107271 [Nonomuraea maritima]
MLELRGRPAEPGGRTERERIGPRQVLDRRHGDPPQAGGHILRKPAPSDRRATVVELTDSGKALAEQIKHLWCALAKETVAGLPADTVAELPGLLTALTNNVDTRRSRRPQGDSAA